jgi:hypothetical protein
MKEYDKKTRKQQRNDSEKIFADFVCFHVLSSVKTPLSPTF